MKKIYRLFGLFIWNSRLAIARNMEYKFNFILGSFIAIVFSSIGPVLQYLIFTQTKGFPGWNLDQIILFQGVLLIVLGLRTMFFGELQGFVYQLVRRGDFDRLLLKPYPPIGIILASGFSMNSLGSILGGIVIIVYSVFKLELQVGIVQLGLFLIFIAVGLMLFMALDVLFSCVVIVLVQMGRLNEFFNFIARFGEYPLSIFPNALRLTFITVVPFAVWVNIPAQLLLGNIDIYMIYSLVFSLVFLFICLRVWGLCLRKYTSAGG